MEKSGESVKNKPVCPLRLLIPFILNLVVHVRASNDSTTSTRVLDIQPKHPRPIYELSSAQLGVSLVGDDDYLQVRVKLREDWLIQRAVLVNNTFNLTRDEPVKNFTVRGIFAGYAWADVQSCHQQKHCEDHDYKNTNNSVQLVVIRRQRTVDKIFTFLIIGLVITANFGMGCSVDLSVVKEVLRRPISPVIGFLCQFGIMPPLSFLLGRVFNLTVAEQLGILAVGSSPGGGASNMWTVLYHGDLDLSITMTLLSTIASFGMFPLWMYTLGKSIMSDVEFTIPFKNIFTSLLGLLVPVLFGLCIQRRWPNVAKRMAKLTRPMLFIFLLFIFTFGIWVNWYMFKLFHVRLILVSCLLPWVGFLGGGLVALICRRPKSRIIAICIETGVQNVGVAIIALRLSLPQPMNDLSITASVCPSIFTACPLILGLCGLTIYRKLTQTECEETVIDDTAIQTMIVNDDNEHGDHVTNGHGDHVTMNGHSEKQNMMIENGKIGNGVA